MQGLGVGLRFRVWDLGHAIWGEAGQVIAT